LLRVSALTGRSVDKIWGRVATVLAERARRVPTATLNQWLPAAPGPRPPRRPCPAPRVPTAPPTQCLAAAPGRTPPPPSKGRPVKIRYVTQAKVAPPEFVFFATGPLPPAYRRYLEHGLRRTFGFQGTPLRVVVRVRDPRRNQDGPSPGTPT